MSEAADAAIVRVMLADFANASENKLNIVGGGITMMMFDSNIGATIPHAVIATVAFPPQFVGEAPAVELALEKADGSLECSHAPRAAIPAGRCGGRVEASRRSPRARPVECGSAE
ncbi:MAG: hypothetical protein WCG47_17400 [Dermatophilaceae bacterium]